MIRSGIKRGLATTAISALAVAGLPLLASSASANPLTTGLGADAVTFYSQYAAGVSAENDGTNSTISLVVGGGTNVTSVQFQATYTPGGTAVNIGAPVARNADGVFAFDWAPTFPAGTTAVEFTAVPNTGLANTATSGPEAVLSDAVASSVELGSEGDRGVFQSPYAADAGADWVGLTGTTSDAGNVALSTRSANPTTPADTDTTASTVTAPATHGEFAGILDIDGYSYSGGTEPNQIVFGAATTGAGATDDAEASTLYVQNITTVQATASRTNLPTGGTADVTVTVKDQRGNPVANALVDYNTPDGADVDTLPDDSAAAAKRTNAMGVATFPSLGKGSYTFYANVTSEVDTQSAGDVTSTPVTLTEYTPVNTSLVASAVDGYSDFDLDEVTGAENGDDFIATLKDQNGQPIAGQPVEYSWHFVPSGGGTATDTAFAPAGNTSAQGTVAIPFPNAGAAGTYTLNVRRPNVNGSGLLNGTPLTVDVAESEITFDGGNSVNAPVNGSTTVTGTLALVDGSGALGGRTVVVTYGNGGGDASFSTDQPAGTTRNSATQVTAVTKADGTFAVSLTDPTVPPNVPPTNESGTLTAVATGLNTGDTTPGPADATDTITVNFQQAPAVGRIAIDTQVLAPAGTFVNQAGPGVPVDLDVTVYGTDNDANPANDPKLGDVPVEVTVDKGFLSPNAETVDDLTLDPAHDTAGDLWGFFKNDGTDETVTTDDAPGVNLGTAGVVAAIEKDTDFDDDGLTALTVTVKAGGVTQTKTITYDVRALLNATDPSFERAAGEPTGDVTVGDRLDFQLYVHDQFGNLAGDTWARISDNSPVADFDTDENADNTLTDFVNSGPGVTAFSDAPATQVLKASMTPGEVLVDSTGDSAADTTKSVTVDSAPITWVEESTPPVQATINPSFTLSHVPASDTFAGYDKVVVASAKGAEAGAMVKLFRVKDGVAKRVKTKAFGASGKAVFKRADLNGTSKTFYYAVVTETATTLKAKTATKGVK